MIKRCVVPGGTTTGTKGVGRLLTALAAFSLCLSCAASYAEDVVRYLAKNESGVYEERSAEGTIVGATPEGIELNADEKNAPEENPIPSERVLWVQFQDAPLDLAAARVEVEVGNYEEALEKLAAIGPDELDRNGAPLIAAEVDWYKAYATLQLALTDATDSFKEGGNLMMTFVKEHRDSYRYYEAQRTLGAAFYTMSERQTKKESKEANLKRAQDAYGALQNAKSEVVQIRGKLGLAKVAFDSSELDSAKALFEEASAHSEYDVEYSEARIGLARVQARQGSVDDALRTLNELLAETPNDATLRQARIYNAIGDVCAEANKPQEAVVAYLHVDLLYPAARSERVAALKALVGEWRKLGREDRAQETVERLRDRFHVEVQGANP